MNIIMTYGVLGASKIYTAKEVAIEVLDCDVGHVYDLIKMENRKRGAGLKASNISVSSKPIWRIKESDLHDFLELRFPAAPTEISPRPYSRSKPNSKNYIPNFSDL